MESINNFLTAFIGSLMHSSGKALQYHQDAQKRESDYRHQVKSANFLSMSLCICGLCAHAHMIPIPAISASLVMISATIEFNFSISKIKHYNHSCWL